MSETGPILDRDFRELLRRQVADQKRYGGFAAKGADIKNRTDVGRLRDSQVFLHDFLKGYPDQGAILIDIGSGLGHPNKELAGVTVYDLLRDRAISSKARIVATDIPSEVGRWPLLGMDKESIPENFRIPLGMIAAKRGDQRLWVLRAANSIDLLMTPTQTRQHFEDVVLQARGREVLYLFNQHILYKPADGASFRIIGNLATPGFAHNGKAWQENIRHAAYSLRAGPEQPRITTETQFQLPAGVEERRKPQPAVAAPPKVVPSPLSRPPVMNARGITTDVHVVDAARPIPSGPLRIQGFTPLDSVKVTEPPARPGTKAGGITDPESVHVTAPMPGVSIPPELIGHPKVAGQAAGITDPRSVKASKLYVVGYQPLQ